MSEFVNDEILYSATPRAVFDKLRETNVAQVRLFSEQDLAEFVTAVQAESSDSSAAYALKADAANKDVLLRNHDDDAWITLLSLDSGGDHITNLLQVVSEVENDAEINGGSSSEQIIPNTKYTLPANDQTTATSYLGMFAGHVTVGGFGGLTWRWRLRRGGTGGTLLLDTGDCFDPGSGSYGWWFLYQIAVDVVGSSGTAWAQGLFFNGFTGSIVFMKNTATVSFPTDVSADLDLTGQITGGGSSDILRVTNGRIVRRG